MQPVSGEYCGCYLCASWVTWASGVTEEEQEEIIMKVEQLIDKVTDTHWGCTPAFDIKLNGNDKNRLFIPLPTDIQTVKSISINCVELDSSWWTYDVNSVFLDPCIGDSMWGTNAIQDGDFYFWTTDDPTTDLYYWVETLSGSSTINRDGAQVKVGNYCVRMDIDADGEKASLKQTIQLSKNRSYKLQFYYKNTIAKKTDTTPRPKADFVTETTLRDDDIFDTDDEFNGAYISIISGTGTDNGLVEIIDTIAESRDIEVASWPGTRPDTTSRYIIFGTLKVKLYNPETSIDLDPPNKSSLKWKIVNKEIVWFWEAGNSFFSQGMAQHLFDPTTAWTLFSAEFTTHSDFAVYDLVFENDGGSSYSIYIDNVGILTAGITAIAADISAGIFPRGFNNIQVIGTYGENGVVPEAIKQAAVILANWENATGDVAVTGLMKSEKIGDYSYTTLAASEADVLTGVSKADMLLRHYIKRKPILMAP